MFDFSVDNNYEEDFAPYFMEMLNRRHQRQMPQYSQQEYINPYDSKQIQNEPIYNQKFGSGSSLMDLLRQRESGGNYGIRNTLGYSGAYQFGAPALEDVGYLRPGAGRLGNKALNDPANWTIAGGLESYLSNPELQDMAMKRLMEINRQRLTRMGHINENTDPRKVNAMLAAAHIAGPGGVKALLQGRNRRDAYGTGAQEYYNLGLRAL